MISKDQKSQMEKKLKLMAEEEEREKETKQKIKALSKSFRDILKNASKAIDAPKFNAAISAINVDKIGRTLYCLQSKNQHLIDSQESLKNDKERIRKEQLNIFEQKQKIQQNIQGLKDTIVKIQKAIDDSVKEEEDKRKKIQDDLDKSITEIKDKIKVFEEETVNFEKQNEELRTKKEELMNKINNLEGQFKKKAEEKDQSVKEDKEKLLGDLKEVEEQVNVATEMSKKFSELEKQNFDNKMAIYLKTQKFPQFATSFQNSAHTIDDCKQQLFIGADRLNRAIKTTKQCEEKSKQLNQQFLLRLKVQTEKEQKINQLKKQKEQIKARILDLQNKKKAKQEN